MPQRFLRPGITSSEKWNALDWITQTFFIRLLTLVDDAGRYEANPQLLKSMAFPMHNNITCDQVTSMCEHLTTNALAIFYKVNTKIYLQLLQWHERQRSPSRYPAFDNNCEQMFANDSKCMLTSSHSHSHSHALPSEAERALKGLSKPTKTVSPQGWEFRKIWGMAFKDVFGADYVWGGAKDGAAADKLTENGKNAESLVALAREKGWTNADKWIASQSKTVAGFASVLNRLRDPKSVIKRRPTAKEYGIED